MQQVIDQLVTRNLPHALAQLGVQRVDRTDRREILILGAEHKIARPILRYVGTAQREVEAELGVARTAALGAAETNGECIGGVGFALKVKKAEPLAQHGGDGFRRARNATSSSSVNSSV